MWSSCDGGVGLSLDEIVTNVRGAYGCLRHGPVLEPRQAGQQPDELPQPRHRDGQLSVRKLPENAKMISQSRTE